MIPEKKKILLVDDDGFLAGIYATKLLSEGFEVVQAFDGGKGIEMAKKEKPDLILLDILMPQMDGFEALKRLKSDKALKNIPVLMLTSLGQQDDVTRGLKEGAAGYLIKNQTLPLDAFKEIKKVLKIQ